MCETHLKVAELKAHSLIPLYISFQGKMKVAEDINVYQSSFSQGEICSYPIEFENCPEISQGRIACLNMMGLIHSLRSPLGKRMPNERV